MRWRRQRLRWRRRVIEREQRLRWRRRVRVLQEGRYKEAIKYYTQALDLVERFVLTRQSFA